MFKSDSNSFCKLKKKKVGIVSIIGAPNMFINFQTQKFFSYLYISALTKYKISPKFCVIFGLFIWGGAFFSLSRL